MDINNINDIETLRNLLKTQMVQLKEDVYTPTRVYYAGEWFFFTQDDDEVFIYDNDSSIGLCFTYDEAAQYIK